MYSSNMRIPDKPGRPNAVKSDVTVAQILHSLHEKRLAGVTEIANHIDRPKSTVHNHLSTLQSAGLVVKQDGKYALSLQFLEYGETARRRRMNHGIIKENVRNLAAQTGERVQYIVEERNLAVYLFIATGEKAVTTDSRIGRHISLHATSAGKSILANLPERKRELILEKTPLSEHTRNTITAPDELAAELETIRERGYATNREEHTRGLRAVGVPVMGPEENVLGAISVSGPTHRMKGDRFEEEIPNLLLASTNEIELTITFD